MNDVIDVEYRVVPDRTPEVIAGEIRVIEGAVARTVIQGSIEIGNRLHEVKEMLPHGEWESWCEKNLNYSQRKAENFMRIATKYGDENSPYLAAISKTHTCADLSISNALRLLKVPEEDVENFVEKVDLSTISTRDLEAEIKALKEEKKQTDDKLKKQADDFRELKEQIAEWEENEKEKAELEKEIESLKAELENIEPEKVEDTAKVDELTASLSAAEDKIAKEIEEKKQLLAKLEEASKDAEQKIAEAKKQAEDEALKIAEESAKAKMDELEIEIARMETKNKELEKKLAAANNEGLAKVKVLVDQLQKNLKETVSTINTLEPETADKLMAALKGILSSYM